MLLILGITGCGSPAEDHALARRELALERLGREIARRVPGARVLVVGNPFVGAPGAGRAIRDAEEAAVRGLRRGLEGGGEIVAVSHPRLRDGALEDPRRFPMPPGATTPLSYLTEPGAWDELRREHPQANVWVSLIGLPVDLASTEAWNAEDGPKWALFLPDLRIVGGPEEVRAAFGRQILAAVIPARGAPPDSEPLLPNREAEFQRGYELLTAPGEMAE